MVSLKEVVEFLDSFLDNSIVDSSHNGLQVQSSGSVSKVGFSVDACMDSFRKAKAEGCDMLITHHGLFWNKKETITGNLYPRVKFLIDNDIALYSSHLPLDVHPVFGNNAGLLRVLGAEFVGPFADVGMLGCFSPARSFEDIVLFLEKSLGTSCNVMGFGKSSVSTVAVVSGSAQFHVFDAVVQGVDLFITGELGHSVYNDVKEAGINAIGAGHYATETFGVRALMPLLKEKFGFEVVFIDNPTGL